MFFKSPHQALLWVAKTNSEPRYEKTKSFGLGGVVFEFFMVQRELE